MKDYVMTMKDCTFAAQDHFQGAKNKLAKTSECLASIHKLDLTVAQSGCVLEGQAIVRQLEADIALAHVALQGLFVKLDEALAEESTRRR